MTVSRLLLGALILGGVQPAFADDAYLRLRCEGDAQGALVTVNGEKKGECPIDLVVPEGTVRLVVRKELDAYRFRLYEKELFLPAGGMKRESVVLGPVQFTPEGQRLEDERIARERAAAAARTAEQQAAAAALAEQKRREAEEAAKYGLTNEMLHEMSSEGEDPASTVTLYWVYSPIYIPLSVISDVSSGKKLYRSAADPAAFANPDAMVAKAGDISAGMSGGIGAHIHLVEGRVVVAAVTAHLPAALAGMRPGDHIVAVDNIRVSDVATSVSLMRGAPGSGVTLTVHSPGDADPRDLRLTRAALH